MNAKSVLAVAAIAAAFSATARAGELDPNYNVQQQVQSQRTRDEVRAEAVQAVRNYKFEPAGSRVAPRLETTVTRDEVRAEAAQAARQNRIAGEEASI